MLYKGWPKKSATINDRHYIVLNAVIKARVVTIFDYKVSTSYLIPISVRSCALKG